MVKIAASVFSVLILLAVVFQILLFFGAPFGECAMGGRFRGSIPKKIRPLCLVQSAVLLTLAYIVLGQAKVFASTHDFSTWI